MPFGEIFSVALDALRVNKLRSILTMLGIIIGDAAVIAMLALGTGAQQAVNQRISSLGTTLLTVIPGQVFAGGVASQADRAPLKTADATALAEKGQNLAGVEPEMGRQLQVVYKNTNASTQVLGTTPNYLDVRRFTLSGGRAGGR